MWPDDRDLPLEVQAAFGADPTADPGVWEWTDLSSRLRADPIRLRAGKSGGTAHVSPGTCTVTLDNDDGALTPLHPLSVYWPNVRRGTPLRVRLRRVDDPFDRTATSGLGATPSGQPWTTSGGVAGDYAVSGGAARMTLGVVNSLRHAFVAAPADCTITVDIAVSTLPTGAARTFWVLGRATDASNYYAAALTIPAAASGSASATLGLHRRVGGTLGGVTAAVSAAVSYSDTRWRVEFQVDGSNLRATAWRVDLEPRPAGWQVQGVDAAITAGAAVGVAARLESGNTSSLPQVAQFDAVLVHADRFNGFADQWEPDYLTTTTPGQADSAVKVTASGLLRRLEQGSKPLFSTPRRFIPTTGPVAYWPLEDGQLASEGEALVGRQPMRPFAGTHPSGAVISYTQWGRGELAPWLPEAVSRSGNAGLTVIWSPVSMPAVPGRWVVDFMYRSGTDAGGSAIDVNPSYLGGSLGWPQLLLGPSFRGLDVAMNGESEVTATAATLYNGQPHHVRWDAYQNGAKVSWNVYVDGVMVNFGTTAGNMTLPTMQTLALTADAQEGADMAQGHVAVWTVPPPLEDAVDAAFGHAGETAAQRITRLGAEEGIAISAGAGYSEPMGPQKPAALVELLRECEDADMGVLFEQGFGLGYRPRGDRYNAPVAMTVDLAQYRVARGGGRDVLAPTYDDQALRNEWTVGRTDGYTATVLDPAHQAQSGVYADSVELNVATDARLVDHASWRVRLGTVDELREAAFPLDLAANPDLLDGWLSCRIGARVMRTNPPAQYQPGALDRLVEGWTETIGPRSWLAQVAPAPAAPWDVAEAGGTQRVPADGSGLAVPLSSSGMSLLLSSSIGNGPWTQDPSDMPLDIRVGGEQVISSAIGPAALDPFTRTVSGSWGIEPVTGQSWQHFGSAASFATTGSVAQHVHQTVNSGRISVIDLGSTDARVRVTGSVPVVALGAGTALTIYAIARFTDDNNFYQARLGFIPDLNITCSIRRRVAGVDTTIASIVTGLTHVAGTRYTVELDVTGSALFARVWREGDPMPGWQTSATDTALTTGTKVGVRTIIDAGSGNTMPLTYTIDDFQVTNPQRVTLSARAVNGVARAWPAGTEVDVWQPAIAAL